MGGPERDRRTTGLRRHLAGLAELAGPGKMATYAATADEVDVSPLVDRWRSAGWIVHLPRLVGAGGMEFAVHEPATGLVPNRYGIAEPDASAEVVPVASLDLVVVPCVAVDDAGTRVGFGAGYYDRALAEVPRPLLVGVAFEVQRFAAVRRQEWDVPLDVVVTDAGVLRP